jgi:colicin import membrane protein
MPALRPKLETTLQEGWTQFKALGAALGVHLLAALLMVLGTMNWKPHKPPAITGMTIEAVMVDTQALIERRETAIQEAEQARQRELAREQRQQELEAQRERERVARERAAAEEAERQRQEAQRKREAELRLQELRQRQERERQQELDRQQAEMDKLRQQREEIEQQRRLEEERLKQLEARRQSEEAAERQAQAEADLQRQLAAEQAAARSGQLADLRSQYIGAIQIQVTNNWLRPPTARSGLRCQLGVVQIPGGEIISASIVGGCNADEATRRSIIAAVERAGTLPYRGFEDVFEREIRFTFTYDDN